MYVKKNILYENMSANEVAFSKKCLKRSWLNPEEMRNLEEKKRENTCLSSMQKPSETGELRSVTV